MCPSVNLGHLADQPPSISLQPLPRPATPWFPSIRPWPWEGRPGLRRGPAGRGGRGEGNGEFYYTKHELSFVEMQILLNEMLEAAAMRRDAGGETGEAGVDSVTGRVRMGRGAQARGRSTVQNNQRISNILPFFTNISLTNYSNC